MKFSLALRSFLLSAACLSLVVLGQTTDPPTATPVDVAEGDVPDMAGAPEGAGNSTNGAGGPPSGAGGNGNAGGASNSTGNAGGNGGGMGGNSTGMGDMGGNSTGMDGMGGMGGNSTGMGGGDGNSTGGSEGSGGGDTLVDVVSADDDFKTLVSAVLLVPGLSDDLAKNELTLFGPTNDALAGLDPKYLTANWGAHLDLLLRYHLTQGAVLSTDLTDGMAITTLVAAEPPLTVKLADGAVTITGSSGFTSNVVKADIMASNGVVHKVDTYFMPMAFTMSLLDLASNDLAPPEVAQLLALSGLQDTLKTQEITIFSPDKDAFAALSSNPAIGAITSDPDAIKNILSYHMVRGLYPRALLTDGTELTTWSNQTLTITMTGAGRFADRYVNGTCNSALITVFDGVAANGLGCFIDALLLPDCDLLSGTAPPPEGAPSASGGETAPSAEPPTATAGGTPTAEPPTGKPPSAGGPPTAKPPTAGSGAADFVGAKFLTMLVVASVAALVL